MATAAVDGRLNSSGGGVTAGDASGDDDTPPWLRDYKSGMEYEVYSLALDVVEDSCLWSLSFSRWAGGQAGGRAHGGKGGPDIRSKKWMFVAVD